MADRMVSGRVAELRINYGAGYRVYLSKQGSVLVLLLSGSDKSDQAREIARRAEMGEKSLFKSLSDAGNPTLETITKVLHTVGLRLSVTPAHA